MEKRKNIRIANVGMVVEIATNNPRIYIQEQSIDDAKEQIRSYGHLDCETRYEIATVLMTAQKCNANLREIRSYSEEEKLKIAFEFESWEDFLGCKKEMEKLSQ